MSRSDFMRRTERAFWVVATGAWTVGALGCGSAPIERAPQEHEVAFAPAAGPAATSTDAAPSDADPCATPATGCPCDVEGQSSDCGIVREPFGDYVRCTPTYRTCISGAWTDCVGDHVVGPR
jgi:hypothetical protein